MRAVLAALLLACAAGPAAAQAAYVAGVGREAGASTCAGGICGAEALVPFFQDLARLEDGAEIQVRVLQVGDSHTAGETIPGAVRGRLQGRFGRAGRGYLAPGLPHEGYAPRQVVATTTGWSWAPKPPRVGGYISAESTGLFGGPARVFENDALTLALDPEAATARLGLCGRDGRWSVQVAGAPAAELELFGPHCRTTPIDPAATSVTIRALGAGGALDGVWLEGPGPGVILSNVGQVGATLSDLAGRDEAVVRAELAPFRPRLIILAFGANEGFDDRLDLMVYEATLRDQIRRMQTLAPGAVVLVLGAPDALRRGEAAACRAGRDRGPPANLARVRDLQRLVASEAGAAYWDWQGRMGGECAAETLATAREPLMRGDRVHFTSAGAEWIGGLLADDLIGAYDAWKAGRVGAPGVTALRPLSGMEPDSRHQRDREAIPPQPIGL